MAASPAQPARRGEPKRLVQVRLPAGMLAEVDARVGVDAEHRSQALRKLIRRGLLGVGDGAESP